jgi:hypothetical protein
MALAGDSAPRAFAVQSAVIGLMSFAGSLAAVALLGVVANLTGASTADAAPYRTVMWLTPVAFAACGATLVAAKPAPRVPSRTAVAGSAESPLHLFVLLGVIVFLFTAGEGMLRAFFNIYLDTGLRVAPAQIGLTMGIAQLLPVVVALTVPGLVARFGTAGTLTMTSLVAAAGLIILGAVPLLPVAGAGYMAAMSMVAVHGATRNLFSQQLVGPPFRTTTAAILTVGMGLGWAGSAVAGGLLLTVVDFNGLFYLTGILAAAAGIVTWVYQRSAQSRTVVAATSSSNQRILHS